MVNNVIAATGRRKEASARVEIKDGNGGFVVGGKSIEDYLKRQTLVNHAQEPLVRSELLGNLTITGSCRGGGLSGQAGALRLAVARALVARNPELRPLMRQFGLMTRDAREVERKKYGQPKARKRFQYSKR
ncbi:MAG: 30S ribosomal protein S9 [bacterium]|nr:30S ribosomal protein S9 [bacterium]